jgi:predicted RNase H-like HicB family nuclease
VHYPIIIEWGDERTATGIEIPDIPGAVNAGDTFEEA